MRLVEPQPPYLELDAADISEAILFWVAAMTSAEEPLPKNTKLIQPKPGKNWKVEIAAEPRKDKDGRICGFNTKARVYLHADLETDRRRGFPYNLLSPAKREGL